MTNVFRYAAIALALSVTAVVAVSDRSKAGSQGEVRITNEGAFRDGLFVGELAGKSGKGLRPPAGRWSDERDRAIFIEGYRRGYERRKK